MLNQYHMWLHVYQIIIFLSYMTFITIKFGIIPSISDSYYYLDEKYNIMFLIFCWSLGFSFMLYPMGQSFFFFLGGSALIITGVATEFRSGVKLTKTVHNISAISSILFLFLGLIVEYQMWIPFVLSLLFVLYAVNSKLRNKIWWVEVVSITLIMIGFFFS